MFDIVTDKTDKGWFGITIAVPTSKHSKHHMQQRLLQQLVFVAVIHEGIEEEVGCHRSTLRAGLSCRCLAAQCSFCAVIVRMWLCLKMVVPKLCPQRHLHQLGNLTGSRPGMQKYGCAHKVLNPWFAVRASKWWFLEIGNPWNGCFFTINDPDMFCLAVFLGRHSCSDDIACWMDSWLASVKEQWTSWRLKQLESNLVCKVRSLLSDIFKHMPGIRYTLELQPGACMFIKKHTQWYNDT